MVRAVRHARRFLLGKPGFLAGKYKPGGLIDISIASLTTNIIRYPERSLTDWALCLLHSRLLATTLQADLHVGTSPSQPPEC